MEWKGCDVIGCWPYYVILNYDLTHDLDLGFWRTSFEIAVSQEREGRLTWNKRDLSQ